MSTDDMVGEHIKRHSKGQGRVGPIPLRALSYFL